MPKTDYHECWVVLRQYLEKERSSNIDNLPVHETLANILTKMNFLEGDLVVTQWEELRRYLKNELDTFDHLPAHKPESISISFLLTEMGSFELEYKCFRYSQKEE